MKYNGFLNDGSEIYLVFHSIRLSVLPTDEPRKVGDFLCDTKDVRKLSFTGSTETGRVLSAKCAQTVKRVSLELGGNAPFIVLPEADLDSAVSSAMVAKVNRMWVAFSFV